MPDKGDAAGIVIEDGHIAVVILAARPGTAPDVTVRYLTHEEVEGLRHRTAPADVREFRAAADAAEREVAWGERERERRERERREQVRDSLIG